MRPLTSGPRHARHQHAPSTQVKRSPAQTEEGVRQVSDPKLKARRCAHAVPQGADEGYAAKAMSVANLCTNFRGSP